MTGLPPVIYILKTPQWLALNARAGIEAPIVALTIGQAGRTGN
jgi:hypothetical protein